MKKIPSQILRLAIALLSLVPGLSTYAGSITNNFTTSFDYVASGIIGDTNWDGVYLRHGDIVGGDPGGSGNGNTLVADTTHFGGGYLSIQSIGTDWAGNANDGFFIYKVVDGDFDVSVQSAPFTLTGGTSFDNGGFHFPGLLVRAYHTNNSGSPFSTTAAAAENFLGLWRFNEFGLDGEIRSSTNGLNEEVVFPGSDAEIASTRYFRITRVGNVFTFYVKTNAPDAWVQITGGAPLTGGTLTRNDWAGQRLQVGLSQATFNTVTRDALFTDFQLSGPNVTFPALPTAPSSLVTTATNLGGSLTFSWNVGTPGNGSLVVMRATGNIQNNPVNGISYTANSTFGTANTLLGGAGEYAVYSGTGTSVTVTNLAGNNTIYTVAVYEYSGSGAATVYNTASPATNMFAGPGIVTGVTATLSPTNIPVGGAALGNLAASFSSGGGTVDESTSPQTSWISSDPTIAAFVGNVLTALQPGTVAVTATFTTFTSTVPVTVHSPAYTDNFSVSHDYIASGLVGSSWDGLFLNFGDVPNADPGPDNANGSASRFISNTNVLTIEAAGSSWWVAGDDGPFIYKIVTGDFQASVHVGPMSTINFCDAGLMARLFDNTGGATQGGGGGAGGTETHIKWAKVQNGIPAVRRTLDDGGTTVVNGLNATDRWLLMQRVNSTNFYMFQSADPTNSGWSFVTMLEVPGAANNAPMQVGIEQEMRSASDGTVTLDTLMIDGPGISNPGGVLSPPPATNLTVTLNGDLSMTFNWIAASNGVPVASILVMRAGGPVTAQPTFGIGLGANSQFGAGQNLGDGTYIVYKSPNDPTTTNNTVTVTGLTPGVTYYAVVYTYVGPFGTRYFNNVVPPTGASVTQQDGQLQSISTLAPPTIPMGGVGQLVVLGNFQGGAQVNVSQFAALTSGDANIVVTADGYLTGLTNGTTTVSVVYGGFTNSANVTVRPPTFTDNFTTNQDFVANHVTGSAWDGVYLNNGDVPESTFNGIGTGQTFGADANLGEPGILSVTNANGQWENNGDDGFFLFKYVPGDFQTAVHIRDYDIVNYTFPGLGARAYSSGASGTSVGAPFSIGFTTGTETNGEDWVSFTRFDEFGIGTYARLNLTNTVIQSTQPNEADGDNWLLMIRENGTGFKFLERATNTAPWHLTPLKTSYVVPKFAGKPMQVGIQFAQYTATPAAAHFDSFMLDAAGPALTATPSGANIVLSWVGSGFTLQSTVILSPPNWQTVPTTPGIVGTINFVTIPRTNAASFFRLKQ